MTDSLASNLENAAPKVATILARARSQILHSAIYGLHTRQKLVGRISSVDMENKLMAHPAVQEAAVIAIPDEKRGECPLACVVLKTGKTASTEELRTHLAGAFAKWQLPDRVEFIDAIPRTSTGKFWKLKLREKFRK